MLNVVAILRKGAAEKAGVCVGDLIASYNGHLVTSNKDLSAAIDNAPKGGELVVYRRGKVITFSIRGPLLSVTTIPVMFDTESYVEELSTTPAKFSTTNYKKDDSFDGGGVIAILAALAFFIWLVWPSAPKHGDRCARGVTPPPGFICR
jgi:hypothetical protein